jgi:chemotaxis protein methyltransferase CheR
MQRASEDNGRLTDQQFHFLTKYLSKKYGLRIPAEKRILLEARLKSRLNSLQINSMRDYLEYTFSQGHENNEYQFFVDQITTHKTFFFRESYQFDFLNSMLPLYLGLMGSNRIVNVWSAGCSTGEEVYTLGIIMQEKRKELIHLDYKITGTDISVPALKKAASGKFSHDLGSIPADIKRTYFHSTQEQGGESLYFVNNEVRSRISLGVLNLNNTVYNLPGQFDFIFCRNVTIYFDAATRAQVLDRIITKLRPGGYIFLGHSETALGLDLPIRSIKPTIYQKIS